MPPPRFTPPTNPPAAGPASPAGPRVAPSYGGFQPLAYEGPRRASYRGQRVNPSQTFQVNPLAGRYFSAPGQTQNALPSIDQFRPDMASLEDATFQRGYSQLAPHLSQQRDALAQRLANQGLPIGSEAHTTALNRLDQSQNQALENLALSSVGAGRQEHSRLTGLAAGLQGQEFGQAMARAGFDSNEARRMIAERLALTQFNAAEQSRGFQEGLASEGQFAGQQLAADQFASQAEQFAHDSDVRQALYGHQSGVQQQQFGQQLGEGARQFDAGLGQRRHEFGATHALARDQFGEARRQFDAGHGLARDQFGLQRDYFGLAQGNQAFQQGLARDQFDLARQGQLWNQGFQQRGQDFGQGLARDQFDLARQGQLWGQGYQQQQADRGYEGQLFQQGLARDQFGLAQQGQLWNQGFQQRGQDLFADQQGFNQNLARGQFHHGRDQDLWNRQFSRDQFDQAGNQWQQQFDRSGQQWDRNFGLQQQQQNWNQWFLPWQVQQQQQLGNRQVDAQNRGSRWGGLASIAGSILPFILSDERAKDDHGVIDVVPIHAYTYKGDDTPMVGPMAQDVERIMPRAVADGPDGMKRMLVDALAGVPA